MKWLFLILFTLPQFCYGQIPGQWTWKSGASSFNYKGHYGTLGIGDSVNQPPGLYEACEWTDKQGNFWLYGGWTTNRYTDDLWRYNPDNNEWTWVKGHNRADVLPVYGLQGVADAANTPGERGLCYSWVDSRGDLWLYGGDSYFEPGALSVYSDLWKYNIAANTWTWMKGDSGFGKKAHYGVKGVEDPQNTPPPSVEIGLSWPGDNDDLWLLDNKGCLWRYRINTNNWIWMKGNQDDTIPYPAPVYGEKGKFNLNNTPGNNFFDYTRWKDSKGNLWYLKGGPSVLWEYDVASNMWAWIYGDTVITDPYYGEIECTHDYELDKKTVTPFERLEARACWIDYCDNLWVMGGVGEFASNDLVYFDINVRQWVWAGNDTVRLDRSIYGAKGVSTPITRPSSRSGTLPFKDRYGNLWLFGGIDATYNNFLADLWMYTIDTTCTKCHITAGVLANIQNRDLKLYPNPAFDLITVSSGEKIGSICIINLLGQTVYKNTCQRKELQVNITDLPAGVYLVKINGIDVRKFVKQ